MSRSYAKYRFREHRKGAVRRNIPFNLTFEQWDNWWLTNGVDRNIPRPNNGDTLCMCRFEDKGPYSLDNIYCASKRQNTKDHHTNNPNVSAAHRKSIKTPNGIFQSKIEAADKLGVHTTTISTWLKTKSNDYYYL